MARIGSQSPEIADTRVIRGNDVIRGTDVTFYLMIKQPGGTPDDYVRYDFLHAKNWEASAELNKEDVPRIGTRVVGKKNGTIAYSGSCNVYYMDPTVRQIFMDYVNTGIWPDISAVVINYDQDSGAGRQIAVHRGVKFDTIILSKFDAESTMLDEDLDFTFESVEYMNHFNSVGTTVGKAIEGEMVPGDWEVPPEYDEYY